MSAECSKCGCDLLGFMEDAFCPMCRAATAEALLGEALEALGRREAWRGKAAAKDLRARAHDAGLLRGDE